MASNITDNQISITSSKKKTLNDLIYQTLIQDGIPPEEVTMHSQAGILIQAVNTAIDTSMITTENLVRESSLLRCQAPTSLYSQLVQHSNELVLATPSSLELMVKIPVDFIDVYGSRITSTTREFVYRNSNTVILDGLQFRAKETYHYIRTFKNSKNEVDIRVFTKNTDGTATDIVFQRFIDNETGGLYVVFDALFEQTEDETQEFTFADDQFDRFIVQANKAITSFSLLYESPSGKVSTVTPKLFFTRSSGDYLEYKYLSNSSIIIDHNYIKGGFKPEITGRLIVNMVTTNGYDIKFENDAVIGELSPVNLPVEYLPIGETFFKSSGGKLASESKEHIRNLVLKLKGTRKRIDTEADVLTYLRNYQGTSKFTPVMTVNDVKSRVFSLFITLAFKETISDGVTREFTIPTDSADVLLNTNILPSYTDKFGRTYYSMNSDIVISSIQNEYYDSYTMGLEATIPGQTSKYYFNFVSPFIHTYSMADNYIRTYFDMSNSYPYRLLVTYNNEDIFPETRFNMSNLRTTLLKEEDEYEYKITTQVKGDTLDCNLTEDDKFKMVLRFLDEDHEGLWHTIAVKTISDPDDYNRYDILFDATVDREIFGDFVKLKYTDVEGEYHEKMVRVKTEMFLDLYLRDKEVDEDENEIYSDEFTLITTYKCKSFSFFEEITRNTAIQSTIPYHEVFDPNNGGVEIVEGVIKFVGLPLIEKEFYDHHPKNRLHFYDEFKNIADFVNKEIYDDLNEYSSRYDNLRDRQETLYDTALKFTKTIGVSKNLRILSADEAIVLQNLSIRPSFLVRKKQADFDTGLISESVNYSLKNQDFITADLSMWNVISDILIEQSDYLNTLQFLNFDEELYPANYHTIARKMLKVIDITTPEIVSIAIEYNEDLGIYQYKADYIPY